MQRRDFLKLSAVSAGAAMMGAKSFAAEPPAASAPKTSATPSPAPVARAPLGRGTTMIGMPISVAPLVQEDLDKIFADMRARAGVNALFPFMYSHEPHRSAARAPVKQFHGGNHGIPHMQYYKDVGLTEADMRAPEFGDVDVMARTIPVAKKYGIKLYPFILEDNARPATIPNWDKLYEVDHHGRRTTKHPGGPCYNNPQYQNLTLGIVEDYARSYEIGGIMWGSERQSGLLNTLTLSQSSGQDTGGTTCFCEFCQKKGKGLGIDVERARQGFDEIEKFVRASRAGEKPRDGHFTTFWRIMLAYPEAIAWANLWVTSRHAFQAALYKKIKEVNPALQMGWHEWHNMSFSPFMRAEEDFATMAPYSDFFRPALYNSVAGGRFQAFVRGARTTVFGDLSPEATLDTLYQQLNYHGEAKLDDLDATGLSADYVQRETHRLAEAVRGTNAQIWPGIEIDVPGDEGKNLCTPESVAAAVKGCFDGGAHGIILSRNYTEMKSGNLAGAGRQLRELGLI